MSEESQNKEQQDGELPRAGERLAAARRDQEISIRDIAKELHLDEAKVQALEQNKFETLGAPVFAKGHLRKYAEIVGVPVDDILTDYYQLNRSVGAPPVVGRPRKVAREIDLTRYIMPLFALLVLAAAVFWWLRSGSPLPSFDLSSGDEAAGESAIQLAPRPQPLPAAPAGGMAGETQAEATPGEPVEAEPSDEPATEPPAVAAEPAPALDSSVDSRPPAPVPAPSGPQVEVTFTFSGDCWTEVTDASGSRLFFDLGREGRTVRVSGTAPLRVLFGSYANVSVSVNGDPFSIPASARRGDTARFTINAR